MSKRIDDILELIDAGLQTPIGLGEVSPTNKPGCVRCDMPVESEDDGLCLECRNYLLGHSDKDMTSRLNLLRDQRGIDVELLVALADPALYTRELCTYESTLNDPIRIYLPFRITREFIHLLIDMEDEWGYLSRVIVRELDRLGVNRNIPCTLVGERQDLHMVLFAVYIHGPSDLAQIIEPCLYLG